VPVGRPCRLSERLAGLVTVVRAEQARRQAGIQISRPAWKNLVFTGAPGTGKSRVARAVARLYHDLGLLRYGELIESAAADLTGTTPRRPGPWSRRPSSPGATC
jgi:predicted ATPase with chaperone activity